MTREELQQKLRELEEMKEAEMHLHESNLYDIAEECRAVDSRMREANRDERIRHKVENMRIENKRQQLFADYKAQGEAKEETKGMKEIWGKRSLIYWNTAKSDRKS